jgi:hypothetical protein
MELNNSTLPATYHDNSSQWSPWFIVFIVMSYMALSVATGVIIWLLCWKYRLNKGDILLDDGGEEDENEAPVS